MKYSNEISKDIKFHLLNDKKFFLAIEFDDTPNYFIGNYEFEKDTLFLVPNEDDVQLFLKDIKYEYDSTIKLNKVKIETFMVPEFSFNHKIEYFVDSLQYRINDEEVIIGDIGDANKYHEVYYDRNKLNQNILKISTKGQIIFNKKLSIKTKFNNVKLVYYYYLTDVSNYMVVSDILPKTIEIKHKEYFIKWIDPN